MTTQVKIEVADKKIYLLLRKIYNYCIDFLDKSMEPREKKSIIKKVMAELFSEERTGFKKYIIEFFEDDKEINYDNLKEAYREFALENTIIEELGDEPCWI